MYYYRARYYSPELGRFISRDPIGITDDINLYAYVGNNPVMYRDPSGEVKQFASDHRSALDEMKNSDSTLLRYNAYAYDFLAGDAIDIAANYDTLSPMQIAGKGAQTFLKPVKVAKKGGEKFEDFYAEAEKILENTKKKYPETDGVLNMASGKNPIDNDLLKPGKYATSGIPAIKGPSRNFSSEIRKEINNLGKSNGCHSCGSKDPGTKSGNFVPDHQPANSIARPGESQKLYPHCLKCSNKQGGLLSSIKRFFNQ